MSRLKKDCMPQVILALGMLRTIVLLGNRDGAVNLFSLHLLVLARTISDTDIIFSIFLLRSHRSQGCGWRRFLMRQVGLLSIMRSYYPTSQLFTVLDLGSYVT